MAETLLVRRKKDRVGWLKEVPDYKKDFDAVNTAEVLDSDVILRYLEITNTHSETVYVQFHDSEDPPVDISTRVGISVEVPPNKSYARYVYDCFVNGLHIVISNSPTAFNLVGTMQLHVQYDLPKVG